MYYQPCLSSFSFKPGSAADSILLNVVMVPFAENVRLRAVVNSPGLIECSIPVT